MPSNCLSSARLASFLSGELDVADEQVVAEHLDRCPRCERVVAELSDDDEARELAAAAHGKQPIAVSAEPQVEDLCRRLHALGLYELAVNEADDDTRPNMDQSPRRTAVFKPVKVQTIIAPAGESGKVPAEPANPAALIPEAPRLKRLGRYEIVRSLGAGTFGIVYLATDTRLHRPVALKIARATVLADDHLRLRFVREAETLAKLQHPHIVPVYEADEVEGLCYLVIAFCDGPTLEQWLNETAGPLDPHLAVKLLLPLVDAVEHAHAHGVLHRDIKPGNVILDKAEGEDAELPFVPKLTDFGLAKVVEEKSNSTLSGVVLGTAQYMAPEQAAGHVERIGPPTDVYALGAVLYQMLTGRPPIEGNTTIDTLRRLLIDDPAEVRSLVSDVPADLDAIVLRCLNKSVTDRYPTAAELAADLRRFLDGNPTIARPLTIRQRASRWLRRNPMRTGLVALATIALGLTVGLYDYAARLSRSQYEFKQAETDIKKLEEAAKAAQHLGYQRDYSNDIRTAAQAMADGDIVQALAALKRQIPPPGSPQPNLLGLEWHYLWSLATQAPLAEARAETEVYQLRLSPDGRELAAACKDGLLRLYNLRDLSNCATTIPTNQIEINCVAYSPDGRLIASVGDDGTIRVYDLMDGRKLLRNFVSHHGKVYGVAFFDGSRKLATCGDENVVRLWDLETGNETGKLIVALEGHGNVVEALAVSPDGKLLATASSDHTCILWDLAKRQMIKQPLAGHSGRLSSVCFSPDGTRLATGGLDKTVCLWNVATCRRLSTETHLDGVQTVAFDATGQCLFAGDRSGSMRRYRIVTAPATDPTVKLVRDTTEDTWHAHDIRVWSVIPGGDENTLITAGADGLIRIWRTDLRRPARRVREPTPDDLVVDLAFSPDGKLLFALHETSGVELLDAATLEPLGQLHARQSRWYSLAVLGDRDEVAAGNAHGLVNIWNWKTGVLRPPITHKDENFTVTELLYSAPAGLLAVLPYEADDVRLYRAESGTFIGRLTTDNHAAAAFSPDGKRLAVDSLNNVFVYDVASRRTVRTLVGHGATIYGLAYDPRGELLASASADRTVRLWNDGGAQRSAAGHRACLADVAFTPDGQTLVSIDDAGVLKLTNVAADRVLLDIPTDTYCLRTLAVAPDSRRLAVLREDHSILLIGNARQP